MNKSLNETEIRSLIPHAGGMCLWRSVEQWDAQQLQCRTDTHRDPRNPLRDAQGLSSIHLIEYGAQAIAIHGGLLARTSGAEKITPGFLASVRNFVTEQQRIDQITDDLMVRARQLVANDSGSIYEFVIEAGGLRLASGRVSVVLRAQP